MLIHYNTTKLRIQKKTKAAEASIHLLAFADSRNSHELEEGLKSSGEHAPRAA
jgi:hypothetical protein